MRRVDLELHSLTAYDLLFLVECGQCNLWKRKLENLPVSVLETGKEFINLSVTFAII